jgi:hypothetical protein
VSLDLDRAFTNELTRRAAARTPGGRDVRAVQMIATRRVPARATAFGTAPAPRAPRAQAGAHPHRTLVTRAEPKPPPPCRPQSATGRRAALGLIHRHRHNHHPFAAACAYGGGSLHWPPEPTASSKRVALAARRGPARRSARGAPAVDAPTSAPRHPAAIATWSARPARGAARDDHAARAGGGDRVGSAARRLARGMAARAVAPCQPNLPLGRSRARYEPTSPRYANCPEHTEAPAKRVATPGRVGPPGRPLGGPGAPTLGRRP